MTELAEHGFFDYISPGFGGLLGTFCEVGDRGSRYSCALQGLGRAWKCKQGARSKT